MFEAIEGLSCLAAVGADGTQMIIAHAGGDDDTGEWNFWKWEMIDGGDLVGDLMCMEAEEGLGRTPGLYVWEGKGQVNEGDRGDFWGKWRSANAHDLERFLKKS
ncbi:hypothetical protein [Salidesulfovibrio brasiliensis]|uniref:hypothetical protein n=1 Tax=Salidesulfovibrio brasiliensis TaxID=221711 RepID=UPI0006D18854|nr:hypothetical protein [Salidesulfovibrio brasiliensis]